MVDTGLGFVQPMFFVGVVEDRNDPRVEGRVRVRAFGVHGSNRDIQTEDLPWATLIIGNHDVNFTPPPLNAWVFGFFIDGRDAQQPMILGLIPAQISELVDPLSRGWGSVPAENYDRESQGSRPRDLGLSPMSRLATGEFLNETYNEALETNRVRNIPVAGGCARGHNAVGNGNAWSNDVGETADGISGDPRGANTPGFSGNVDFNELSVYRDAIARIESAGSGDYQAIARRGGQEYVHPRYGRALGRYQIMETNVRDWSVPAIGREVSADEFLSSPRIQDQIFDWRFSNYIERFGPLGAAQAWFAGEGGVGKLSRQDVFGTSVSAYTSRFQNAVRQELDRRGTTLEEIRAAGSDPSRLSDARSARQDLVDSQTDTGLLGRAAQIRTEINRLEQERDALGTTGVDAIAREQKNEQIRQKEAELAALDTSNPTQGTANEPYSGYANPSSDPSCVTTWDEPPSGYSARYPYNRVIETASGHSIELDDTPGGERIMIWHRDGSYVQITGTSTTHKNMSDAYHVNERNNHVYIGGNNIVTIEGDSYVLVKGDKVEEIEGNYKQIVHGNVQIGGGGRVEINGADRTDIRSAALALDSNVENLNVRTGKNIIFESGESFNVKSKNVRMGASESMSVSGKTGLFLQSQGGDVHVKSDGSVFMNPNQNLFLRTEGGTISAEAKGSIRFNSSGSFISIHSSSYMSLGSKTEMLIGSEGGSLNLNSSDKLGISAADLFLSGSSDVNITGGQNVNVTGGSDFNIKAGGAGYVSSGAVLNLLAGSDARLTGSDTHIRGSTVFIDDIVQLANGGANGGADEANEAEAADTKEPVDPSRFGDGTGEMGGDVAEQAEEARLPDSAQTAAAGPPPPPDRTMESPSSKTPRESSSPTTGNPIVAREATQTGVLDLGETNVLGILGTSSSPRALIRLPNGRVETVRPGSILEGQQVSSIDTSTNTVVIGGRPLGVSQ